MFCALVWGSTFYFTILYINYSFYRDILIEQETNTTFWAKCCLCHQDTKEKLHSTGEGQDANHIKQARYPPRNSLFGKYLWNIFHKYLPVHIHCWHYFWQTSPIRENVLDSSISKNICQAFYKHVLNIVQIFVKIFVWYFANVWIPNIGQIFVEMFAYMS